jgi:hypothetical protein
MECHECGATISEKAADCPRCGTSVRPAPGGDDPAGDGATTGDAGGHQSTDDTPSTGSGHHESTAPDSSTGGSESDETAPGEAETTLTDASGEETEEETGWEAAGPPPDEHETDPVDRETRVDRTAGTGDHGAGSSGQEPSTGGQEPTVPGGQEPGTGGQEVTPDQSTAADEPVDSADSDATDAESSVGSDPVARVRELPLLTAPLAGVVTAVVVTVLSVVVGVLVPNTAFGPVTMGGLVVMDLHFATARHVTTGILTQFDTARPPNSVLGVLYLLPPLFLYTASKFVAAYNTDESTLTPMAGVGGSLVAVGYFPAMVVAFVLAPGGPVSVLPAILLAGIVYPVSFGFVGGLAGGAFSGSERRVSTLYGVDAFLIVAVGAFALTVPSIQAGDVGILPQIHASLFSVVAVNGFSLGGASVGVLVLLTYPLVALVGFATGFLRSWNAGDVTGPLRGLAKGLSPAVTYVTLLGLLGTVLPLLADPWVADELGFSLAETTLVQDSIASEFSGIGRYVTVVFLGTLVYAVVLGGLGGTIAGTARSVLSDPE